MTKKPEHTDSDPHAEREAMRYDQPIASREHILTLIKGHRGPCTMERVIQLLDLHDPDSQEALRRRLKAMVRDGQLVLNRKEGYLPVNERDLMRGRVIAHPDGFGFLHPDEGGDDLFIPPKQMRALLHDDRAVMRVTGIDRRGRREAALVEVLERANTRLVGRLFFQGPLAFVVADNKRITQDVLVQRDDIGAAQDGQIVIVEIIEQPTLHHPPMGKVIEVLGDHMAPGMEIDVAINAHNIPNVWPNDVIDEAREFGPEVREADKVGRLDLRKLPLVTIDGEDAKDFDDAVYCEPAGKGWRLYVAIADVSFYVKQGSLLDREARNRATSVYFPGQVIPMLPEALSNGLCSLNPDVDRLCMVCIMEFDHSGHLQKTSFSEAVMRSHARLTYTQVAGILVERDSGLRQRYNALIPPLENLHTLYKQLDSQRQRRGSIDFDTIETKIVFGENRKIEDIVPVIRNDAHRLIEEFMIAANISAAGFLLKHKILALYRNHEPPPADKFEDLLTFLGEVGLKFPVRKQPQPKHFAELLQQVRKRPDFHLVQTVILRSLSQAQYHPNNLGHFGLALKEYAHFTSPIRRYPDLLVHRAIRHILKGGSTGNYPYTETEMLAIGEYSSMAERRADEATRDASDWLKCEYIQDKVGESFDGIITGVTSFGVFVELRNIYVEGLVHITSLPKDYYRFDAVSHKLTGERSGRVFQLADEIRVTVAGVSLESRQIDFESADSEDAGKAHSRKRRKSR
jgi:ribonuclease R